MDLKRYPRFRRPGHAVTDDRRTTSKTRATRSVMTTSTPSSMTTAPGLRRAADRRAGLHDDGVRQAGARMVRRPRHYRSAPHDGRGLELHPQRRAARPVDPARDPPHRHAALHAALKREGRALPSDNGTRVAQGPAIPQQHRPQPSAATLAQALQPAQTPQLTRRPRTHQPRSQPLGAGQLAAKTPI